jgi:hypothetical protein
VNAALYIWNPNPWSLGGAVLCGGLAVYNGARSVRESR